MGVTKGEYVSLENFLSAKMIILGQVVFPIVMMLVYYFSGYYNVVFRKSRLQELLITASSTFVNTLIIFFVALINDVVLERSSDYELVFILWGLQFSLVYAARLCITTHTTGKLRRGQLKFRALLIGSGTAAYTFAGKVQRIAKHLGYDIVGFVDIPGENRVKEIAQPVFKLEEIADVCKRLNVDELIVAPSKDDGKAVLNVVNHLFPLNLPIMMTADGMNFMQSRVKLKELYASPLTDISGSNMSESGKNIKRGIDILVSIIALIVLMPVFAVVAVAIKLDSKGSVFFKQERVGFHNKPFKIIKFRSMVKDAEKDGKPLLSSEDDPRVTKVGRVMRKYRIDEFPQFWNVLRGDMSIVGPRPERQFYINQIVKRMPSYALLHQVRPGITSMGMVNYGYAKSIDEMIERAGYDLLYLENMSILNDLKILIYTVKIVFSGRGM